MGNTKRQKASWGENICRTLKKGVIFFNRVPKLKKKKEESSENVGRGKEQAIHIKRNTNS